MAKPLKSALKIILAALLVIVLVVAGYIGYMYATYDRIEDNQTLEVRNNTSQVARVGERYTALTYNIGFGAYTPDYSFFMDTGVMKDGTETQGEHSCAVSEESVLSCIEGDIELIKSQDADIVLLQEVDSPSTRSRNVDQLGMIESSLDDKATVNAVNFHSSFIAYPVTEPHGFANSSIATFSSLKIESSVRRSYPTSQSFSKFFDLDRCFSVSRIPVNNGKELVVANSHMSAYDEGGVIRAQQLAMINDFLKQEVDKGNYVVLGGDFNHALCGSVELYKSEQEVPSWVSLLNEGDLTDGVHVVRAENLEEVATCRGADIPYENGVTYQVTVDGFIVSDNIEATAQNVDNGYAYSDHNPVKLTFALKK